MLDLFNSKKLGNLTSMGKDRFLMYTFIVQTEDEYLHLIKIEKEETIVLNTSQKKIRELTKGLDRIQICNKKKKQIHRCKRGRISRQTRKRQLWIKEKHHHSLLDKTNITNPNSNTATTEASNSNSTPTSCTMAMNWSCFKPGFSGKPEEDPEAHKLRMIDWMDTHYFVTCQRVQILYTFNL